MEHEFYVQPTFCKFYRYLDNRVRITLKAGLLCSDDVFVEMLQWSMYYMGWDRYITCSNNIQKIVSHILHATHFLFVCIIDALTQTVYSFSRCI